MHTLCKWTERIVFWRSMNEHETGIQRLRFDSFFSISDTIFIYEKWTYFCHLPLSFILMTVFISFLVHNTMMSLGVVYFSCNFFCLLLLSVCSHSIHCEFNEIFFYSHSLYVVCMEVDCNWKFAWCMSSNVTQ